MGRQKPEVMRNKPIVRPGNTLYLQAFYDLDGERQIGMSIGRIPWSSVHHYAGVYAFSDAQTHALHYLIGRMDAVNLQYIGESMKRKGK